MEGYGWLLLIGIIFTGLFIIIWTSSTVVVGKVTETTVKKEVESRFERINAVEGILYADNLKIKTFNIGDIEINDTVEISFYNCLGAAVHITDITFNKQSIYAFAPVGLSYRDKADFALQVLKNNVIQGSLDKDTVTEVEHMIIDVDNLNKYIGEGKVSQVDNEEEDFIWV
ncbi:hypothetical protein ABWK22_02810 [Gottfriedia acidiceleris]|uniref:hypothetical protein n=1 Tax=Gottfriedia acidiceleris TaxID=371036 RepID=UPI00339AF883